MDITLFSMVFVWTRERDAQQCIKRVLKTGRAPLEANLASETTLSLLFFKGYI